MLRRDFLRRSAKGLGAAWLASNSPAATLALQPLPQKVTAHDEVVLGKTGIRTTRLAMGTGTVGFGGSSNQVRLGSNPFTRLLLDGYHDNGLSFFDTGEPASVLAGWPPAAEPPDVDGLVAALAEYGVTVVGPPPAPTAVQP